MPPPAVADQASFAHVAEFFNSLLAKYNWRYRFYNTPKNFSDVKRAAGNGVKLVISQGLNVAVDV